MNDLQEDVIYIQMELCTGTLEAEWRDKEGRGGGGHADDQGTPFADEKLRMVPPPSPTHTPHTHVEQTPGRALRLKPRFLPLICKLYVM